MFSGIKNRLRFNHAAPSSSEPSESTALTTCKSTPDLSFKSTVKDPASSSFSIRRLSGGFDEGDDTVGQTTSFNSTTRSFEFREDPSFWNDHNVQVIIRLRPLNNSELSVQGQGRCVRQDCSQSITWIGNPESRFTFDLVADEHVSQEMLFKVAGIPMVENCVGGYNSCMFAYGQTGSGKTHTMLGDIEEGTRRHSVNCGMTPRVFEYLFSRIQKEKEVRREEKIRFTCRCSFLEIYNEHILDLLDPSSSNLQIREDTKKGVYVENLTEVEVTSARDVIQQLVQGAANRKVAATNMNRASSRSHSVFTCVVESKWESQGVTHHRFSRLNLVDLAGSERQKSSGAEGERLKEATNINKSLSTLGLVIMNLVNMTNGKSLHVPYRDSKLTFLLQDSLGGNAKTIIIANISPSSCSSLETLSTLKFAQRAKFIKNNAIVNEDASGDVLAMRAQIENLKKEVARLRSLHNGGADYHEGDSCLASIPGTPGPFNFGGLNELSTPLTKPHKKTSQSEYEIALVGAFRREMDKDITIQTLTAESQAALQLTKQREDEIQGLKMMLRFREAAIKRLQAVASGKISAETHLVKEKEEHLKEIDILRNEVSCNPEVTRFAMENLRVKEEIRRLKSFYEEGERERMMEQINILQNKLLEALDWKLMHESNISTAQKERFKPGMVVQDDGFLLSSGQESASPWRTILNEENEFLRMQAIHTQSELDALHKRLDLSVHEKEKLESHVKELEAELEAEKSSRSLVAQELQRGQFDATDNLSSGSAICDQVELKTMVEAIATASEREAEAHETAITLSRENDQLRMKLKVLLDDNNKLIELYEKAVAENQITNGSQSCQEDKELDVRTEADNLKQQLREMHDENDRLMALYEKVAQKELDVTEEADNLKKQLMELHEENNKLMGLYEKAMLERGSTEADNLKQQLREMLEENDRLMALYEKAANATAEVTAEADNLKQQLAELHEENDKLMGLYEKAMLERDSTEADSLKQKLREMTEENDRLMALYEKAAQKELDVTAVVENLKQQLIISLYEKAMQEDTAVADNLKQQLGEVHVENDRLMAVYENASQRELDVTTEGDNFKQQLIDLHEENDKLMGLYEKAMQERGTSEADNLKQQLREMHEENDQLMALYEKGAQKELDVTAVVDNLKQQLIVSLYEKAMQEDTTVVDDLKQQLREVHEENERLMAVYEKASSRVLDVTREGDNFKQQLIELHEENDKLMGLYEKAMQERGTTEAHNLKQQLREMHEENDRLMALYEKAMQERGTTEADNLKQQLREMHEENDRLMALYEKASQKELDVTAEADNLKQRLIIGLYEKAMQEDTTEADNMMQQLREVHEENDRLMAVYEKAAQKELDVTAEIDNLKQQLMELHEENDKLMALYEKAMQERDELKQMLVSAEQKCMDIKGVSNFPEKLVEVEGGHSQEFTFTKAKCSNVDTISENEAKLTDISEVTVWEDLNLIRQKLGEAQERLSNSAVNLNVLSSLEKTILEVDELSQEIKRLANGIEMKQKSFESSKHGSLALQERRAVLHKKLIALKCSISKFVSSVGYFGQREAQGRVRCNSLSASINQKKEELARLEICKGEIVEAQSKMEESEVELRSNLSALKVKLEEENRRLEKDRVLVTIDNIEKTNPPAMQTNWQMTSKATDLLKSEEEIPKLQSEIKKIREKLAIMKKNGQELDRRAAKVNNDIKMVQLGIQADLLSVEEVSRKLQSITQEKEMVLAMQAEGRKEYENMTLAYYERVFEAETSEDEMKILDEDVQMELSTLESLQKAMVAAIGRKAHFLEKISCQTGFVSEQIEEDLYCVNRSIVEVKSMLPDFNSNDS